MSCCWFSGPPLTRWNSLKNIRGQRQRPHERSEHDFSWHRDDHQWHSLMCGVWHSACLWHILILNFTNTNKLRFDVNPSAVWRSEHPGALWLCCVSVHLPFLVLLDKQLCAFVWGWGCCFYAHWVIAQGGMCPFQGKLTMPVVQPPVEPCSRSLSLSLSLSLSSRHFLCVWDWCCCPSGTNGGKAPYKNLSWYVVRGYKGLGRGHCWVILTAFGPQTNPHEVTFTWILTKENTSRDKMKVWPWNAESVLWLKLYGCLTSICATSHSANHHLRSHLLNFGLQHSGHSSQDKSQWSLYGNGILHQVELDSV